MPGSARSPLSPLSARPSRPARTRLLAPFAVLAVLGVGLSAFWFYASTRTRAEIDSWLAREAAVGRAWSCGQSTIAGYPFRIAFTCEAATFQSTEESRAVSGSLGKVVALAQVYSPKLLLIEADGPLSVTGADGSRLQASWSSLRASLRGEPGAALERLSVEGDGVSVTLAGPLLPEVTGTVAVAELHIRPTPDAAASAHSFDLALMLDDAVAPGVALVFGREAVDVDGLATLTQAQPLAGGDVPAQLARWQAAGGQLRLTRLGVGAPDRRVDARGEIGLDDAHRLQGRIDLTLTGLDRLMPLLTGGRGGVGPLLGGLLGRPREPSDAPAKPVALTLTLADGKARLGPLTIGILQPLY
jgi:hypothetical protein